MKVIADAATGDGFWEARVGIDDYMGCCGPVNRGAAVAYGKVYVATLDATLVALDARSGKQLWRTKVADPAAGYSETMTPQVHEGLVIVGSSGGEWPLRGFVAAFDGDTGKERWRWHSTDPNSFAGDSWRTGGGMVWNTPAIDPERGLAIFAAGNPNPDFEGESRQADNLYTDSIVALDVKTGKLKWHYQEVKHDLWDYDPASNVVLFDVERDGKKIPAAGQAGKVGWLFIVNRTNGELMFKSEPFVKMSDTMFATPTQQGVTVMPGANGGANWSPPAYSPDTNLVYVLGINQPMRFTTRKPVTTPGQVRLGSSWSHVEGGPETGVLSAIDVNNGKIAWQYETPHPLVGGVVATGGNLVFVGEGNRWLDALNAKTGERLWRFRLSGGVNAPPITYAVNGQQFVAVAAGGSANFGFPLGDAIAIFKLPDASSPR